MPLYEQEIPNDNTMFMLGHARRWLRELGHPEIELQALTADVMGGDRENALRALGEYFIVQPDN